MHRLEDEVVLTVGNERTHELRAFRLKASTNEDFFFAAPIDEVVVDVEHGNAGLSRTRLELDEGITHLKRALQDCVTVGELESCEHVDEQQRYGYRGRACLRVLSRSHVVSDAGDEREAVWRGGAKLLGS